MKIEALRLYNVKRFADRGVAIEGIGDGVNVLCAVNEFGKSTSFEALHALFFLPHSGASGDVRALRPYSGGSPMIEADIATGDGRFRIAKRFYAGRSARVTDLATGRLVAQADEAENFIAALVRGGSAGPAGLLWVRQGVTGIERRSRSEDESERQVRASLLESVQGEVEAVTGGRRMAAILAATQDALAELVTPTGKIKAGGRYSAAIEARDRLAADVERLGADVTALRAALDQRAVEQRRLDDLERADDRAERRQAVQRAETAFEAARAQSERLKAAEAELRLAQERKGATASVFKAFHDALEKQNELSPREQEAALRRSAAEAQRLAAVDAAQAARTAFDASDDQAQAARTRLDRAEAAVRAQEASRRLAEVETRLQDAEGARLAAEAAEAALALHKTPPAVLDELQALEVEIAGLRAAAEAARPSVTIAYEPGAAGRLAMDGAPLADGEERGYDGAAELVAPGFGVITLRSNHLAGDDGRLARALDRRRALLASLGVEDFAGAQGRRVRAQQAEAELRGARARLAALAPDGLPKLREQAAALRQAAQAPDEDAGDPAALRSTFEAAEQARAAALQALREAEPSQRRAHEQAFAAERALAALTAERMQLDAVLGPESERAARAATLRQARDACEATLAEAAARVEALRAAAVDIETAEAALRRARSVEDAAAKEAERLRQAIAELNGRIRASADDAVEEAWREAQEAHAAAARRAENFAGEVRALQRLEAALAAARAEARELYLKPVMAELQPLLGLLFDDASIAFDDRTLLPQTLRRNGLDEDVERLSGGMREQLSVLTRLAFARLLARDGRPAPVILDDALVYSDDDRIELMFDALHRQARDQQIIVFSCRQRAFARLGGNALRMTDWRPQDAAAGS